MDKLLLSGFAFAPFCITYSQCNFDLATQNFNLTLSTIKQYCLSKASEVIRVRAKFLRHRFIMALIFNGFFFHFVNLNLPSFFNYKTKCLPGQNNPLPSTPQASINIRCTQ